MNTRPPVPQPRSEPREIVELNRLKAQHPELAPAVDLQVALLALQRRVQARVPVPSCLPLSAKARLTPEPGHALLRFADLPLDWNDFRRMLHETAGLLRRFDAIEEPDVQGILEASRAGRSIETMVERWYVATSSWPARAGGIRGAEPEPGPAAADDEPPEGFQYAFSLALRPFLARCAEALMPQLDLSAWREGRCPLCGGEPELAVFRLDGVRQLVCGRCTARWPYEEAACPHCGNADAARLTSLQSADGRYRLDACDACQRYVKGVDERRGARAALPAVDTIATLPLDAAALQRGYRS